MWLIDLLVLIALGLLGIAAWLRERRPDLGGPLRQLEAFEGWIGVVGLAWGLLGLLQWTRAIGTFALAPVLMLFLLVSTLVIVALSLILALPLLKSWLGAGGASDALADVSAKLAPYKVVLGAACLGFAAYSLVRMAV